MAMTLEQLQATRDAIVKQLSAYQEMQSGDKRLVSQSADDLRQRLSIIDAEITKLSTPSSGYVTRFYTRG